MSWLTEFVRPKIQQLVRRSEVPENLWHKCPSCEQMIFHRDLAKNHHVCQHCGHHMRISAKERLELLFDESQYQLIELPGVPMDPLKFKDQKKYTDRLKAAQAKATYKDALAVAHGTIGSHAAVVAVFDFSFMGGSMGTAVGEGIVAAAELAIVQDAALIIVPASGGARMQEGILSLMQMARTTAAIEKVKEKGLPYFVLLTDPTTGGVSASFAMLGDIQIAEPGAQIGFAGRRVIENTIREKLPDDFQTAEYLLDHGMVDMVVPRPELHATFSRLIDMIRRPKPGAAIVPIKDAKKSVKKVEKDGDATQK
ncbi:MAG: acetyl-CoA carboxylase, carboxyltransferase subunit beta [Pseudomonadota bacterium]